MSNEIFIDEDEIKAVSKKHNIVPLYNPGELHSIEAVNIKAGLDEIVTKADLVISPILPKQEILYLYAATGAGKTLFALNLAYAIANGGSFLRYTVPLPRKVLYIDGEMSFVQMQERLKNIQSLQGELYDSDYFWILNPDKFKPAGSNIPLPMPKIDDPYGQQYYIKLIQRYGTEVVVFDNYSTLALSDENKNHDWAIVQSFLSQLKALGLTIIFIHHAGKGGSYRGTSRMTDIMNTVVKLERINEDMMEEDVNNVMRLKVIYEKCRSFNGKDAMSFEATYSAMGWSHRSLQMSLMEMVVERVALGLAPKEIAIELKKDKSWINKIIREAKRLGLIRPTEA